MPSLAGRPFRRKCLAARVRVARVAATYALALAAASTVALNVASAQPAPTPYLDFKYQLRPVPVPKGPGIGGAMTGQAQNPDSKMLVQADELDYDYNNQRVSAVGNVRMYYQGATIEADRIVRF